MYRSRDDARKTGLSHTGSIIPKPFILGLLAAKTTCTIRRRFVHAPHPVFKSYFMLGGSCPFRSKRTWRQQSVRLESNRKERAIRLYNPSYGLQFPACLRALGDLKKLQSLSLPLGTLFRQYANHLHNNMVNKLNQQSPWCVYINVYKTTLWSAHFRSSVVGVFPHERFQTAKTHYSCHFRLWATKLAASPGLHINTRRSELVHGRS